MKTLQGSLLLENVIVENSTSAVSTATPPFLKTKH